MSIKKLNQLLHYFFYNNINGNTFELLVTLFSLLDNLNYLVKGGSFRCFLI